MDIDEITEGYRYSYTKECQVCGLTQEILTQRDNFPEYYTEIYLKCQCGSYLEFELPVN